MLANMYRDYFLVQCFLDRNDFYATSYTYNVHVTLDDVSIKWVLNQWWKKNNN